MPVGYKMRKWQAVLTVSASGPEFSPVLDEGGRFLKPRMAADLRYTTADVDFLEAYFHKGDYDSGKEELHRRLRNPTLDQFHHALNEIEDWFARFRHDPDWDGGGVLFCFAGHGRQGDGALVLADGVLRPDQFIDSFASIADSISRPGRLRLSALLDSCHSAAFTTKLLHACFNERSDLLVPFHVYASYMEDEFAWEESGLGHGVFTYSFSVREPSLGSVAAKAIQPDNSFGPSLAIAGGNLGCSFLTAGRQNPVRYWNGTGHLEIGTQDVNLFENGECMTIAEMRAWLKHERDRLVEVIRPARQDIEIGDISSDEEMCAQIHDLIQFLLSPMGSASEESA
jgi:hypothetical protein